MRKQLPYPEYLEGIQARKDGKLLSANPYKDSLCGQDMLWDQGWEWQKEYEGSRYWCDHCQHPLYDADSCGNCGRYGST